jgi:hypothetical protein
MDVALLSREPAALWRRTFDATLVLPPGRSDLLVLEGSGAVIWNLLESPLDEDELATRLLEFYDEADRDRVVRDVKPFVQRLLEHGALRWV